MEKKKDTSGSVLGQVFETLAKRLREDFKATNIGNHFASSRTGVNREWIVHQFFQAILPLSVEVRLGATLIDAFDQTSRDVDIVLLNPWACPIWPYAHGTVPVEGVLTAVFVESKWPPAPAKRDPKKTPSLWIQCASAKSLLKSMRPPGDYASKVRRTFRVETGVWVWSFKNKVEPDTVLDNLMKHKHVLNDAMKKSVKNTARKGWIGHQPGKGNNDIIDKQYLQYQAEVGAFMPNWIYLNGVEGNESLLMLKIQGRHELSNRNEWELVTPKSASKLQLANTKPNGYIYWDQKLQKSKPTNGLVGLPWDDCMWAYAFYNSFNSLDPLKVLALQLAHGTTLYGRERTDYGAYFRSL